jgi:hypothetical protein
MKNQILTGRVTGQHVFVVVLTNYVFDVTISFILLFNCFGETFVGGGGGVLSLFALVGLNFQSVEC